MGKHIRKSRGCCIKPGLKRKRFAILILKPIVSQGWQSLEERKTALVFTTADGRNICPQTLTNHYKKIVNQIGIPESRVHDLRHTFAVLSLQNGDDVKTVQENLGHATAAFTLDIYGHVSEKMKQDSADRMQQYISSL